MNKEQLIQRVGREAYAAACEEAKRTAAATLRGSGPNLCLPHDLTDMVWDSNLGPAEKVALVFELYFDMPGYAHLMYLSGYYDGLPQAVKHDILKRYQAILNEVDDMYSAPVEYSLWVDFFEDLRTVEEAWHALFDGNENERLIERVLRVSGPVRCDLKARLYERLIDDPRWHVAISLSLLYSIHDAYGRIDLEAARSVFAKLKLAPETEHLEALKEGLKRGRPR
jgi:hypothetical protein